MLELITIILFAAVSTASFSKFFDYCMEQGNILHFYYLFLMRKGKVIADKEGNIISASFWAYPMGLCINCFNFWAGVLPYSLLMYSQQPGVIPGIVFFFSFQGLSFIFLQEFNNRYNE